MKVLWSKNGDEEVTWETERKMQNHFPELMSSQDIVKRFFLEGTTSFCFLLVEYVVCVCFIFTCNPKFSLILGTKQFLRGYYYNIHDFSGYFWEFSGHLSKTRLINSLPVKILFWNLCLKI